MKFYNKKKENLHIELTPLIDMVFILLVFFMISSTFLKPVINMRLPVAGHKDEITTTKVVVISIDKDKNIYVNQKKTTFKNIINEINAMVKNNKQKSSIVFSADKEINYGMFVSIIDILKENGFEQISLEYEDE